MAMLWRGSTVKSMISQTSVDLLRDVEVMGSV